MYETYLRLNQLFEGEWLDWEWETITASLPNGETMDVNKVMGLQVFLLTEGFFNIPFLFEKMVVTCTDRVATLNQFEHVTPVDIMKALKELRMIPEKEWEIFDEDVVEYIVNIFRKARVYKFPRGLFMDEQNKYADGYLEEKLNAEQQRLAKEMDVKTLEEI